MKNCDLLLLLWCAIETDPSWCCACTLSVESRERSQTQRNMKHLERT